MESVDRRADAGRGWYIRPYRESDEAQLVSLFASVFGRHRSVGWWRWKLKGLPAPVENVWVAVSETDGQVVGQYAGIPVRLQSRGVVRDVMVSVDTMTAPDFRRRGVLSALGTAAYASWAQAGVAAVLGLPNEQWGSRTVALGWVRLFPLAWMRVLLRWERVARSGRVPAAIRPGAVLLASLASRPRREVWRRHLARTAEGIEVREIKFAGAEVDDIWSSVSPQYANLLVRDSKWVNWRYLQAHDGAYKTLIAYAGGEPAGYLAYRWAEEGERLTGYLADLFTAPGAKRVASALMLGALDDLWVRGAGAVLATASPGSALDGLLRLGGFRRGRGAFSFDMAPLDPRLDVAWLSKPQNWMLTGGDFDVV